MKFRDSVLIESLDLSGRKKLISAMIFGKIKNINAYVIISKEPEDIKYLKNRYGYPIRQLELEWGKFSGSTMEFIIPEIELTKT